MKYREHRDASDRLVVAIEDMPSPLYKFVRWRICRKFQLKKSGDYTKGLNEKFQSFRGVDGELSIDWDNWSGFMVTAKSLESEPLVKKIGTWLEEKYGG